MTRKVAAIKRQQQMAESVGVHGDDDTHLSACPPPPLRRGESSGDGCGQMRISLNVLRENLTIN